MLFIAGRALAWENRPFKFFTVSEGLPTASVGCCCQDVFGRIWLGTKDGICYYDGYSFHALENPRYNELFGGSVISMTSDGENTIWFASSSGVGYIDTYTDEIRRIENIPDAGVRDIVVDPAGDVWLSFPSMICLYDMNKGCIIHTISTESGSVDLTLLEDGRILFVSSKGVVSVYDKVSGNMSSYRILSVKEVSEGINIEHVAKAREGYAIVSTSDYNIFELDLDNGVSRKVFNTVHAQKASIITCLSFIDDEYWIGTADGIHIMDRNWENADYLAFNRDSQDAYSGDNIRCIYPDRSGNVWVGTNGGLKQFINDESSYRSFVTGSSPGSISGQTIRTIVPDEDGRIWIGSEEGEICRFDPKTGLFRRFTEQINVARGTSITGMLIADGLLWVATYGNGIVIYDMASGVVKKRFEQAPTYCLDIIRSHNGDVYAAAAAGLYKYDPDMDSFRQVNAVGKQFVHTVLEDRFSRLWIGTFGSGLGVMDPATGDFMQITVRDESFGLKSNYISSFFEDSSGNIWFTTDGGGIARLQLNEAGDVQYPIIHFTRQEGFPTNNTCAITEDRNGKLWVSTSNGLVEFNPEHGTVDRVYMQANTIIGGSFVYGACFHSPDGTTYMGTSKGMAAFNLEKFSGAVNTTPLLITDIHTAREGQIVPLREEGHSVTTTREIKVRYKDLPYISFTFYPVDFSSLNNNEFEYSLKGYKRNSSVVTSNNTATYTDLPPGKYQFMVKLVPSNSPEASRTVDITVIPPWYRSIPAWIAYFTVFLATLALVAHMRIRHQKEEHDRRIARLETTKQKELYDAKINFFTNITHEVRTPLTLIKIPLEKILDGDCVPEKWRSELLMIQANTNRLLKLTNRMLDINKIEVMKSQLSFEDTDIRAIVERSCSYFDAAVNEQGMVFDRILPKDPLVVSCNEEAIESIVCNLLSNAIKHCSSSIGLQLECMEEKAVIRVSNDGHRIPEKEHEKIFEAFYQAEDGSLDRKAEGTGLGLTYSRSLARLHTGSLYLDTSVKDVNEFVLELPLHQKLDINNKKDETTMEVSPEEQEQEFDTSRYNILIVEDDREMRILLGKELSENYNILLASNGKEALGIIEDKRVDMVISDIMMPIMDGCELCNAIKSDLDTSHIPVILLTAAVGIDTHIKTLRVGADGYIEKPFSMTLVKETAASLFKNREIANKQFINAPLSHFHGMTVSALDQDFMDKFHSLVLEHMSEVDLSMDSMAEMLAMSKSTLYRKLKANTGMSVSEYIRLCRMKKAAELLSSNQYRINEVAYIVGFSSGSYFAANFQKQFGVTPSEFKRQLKDELSAL